MLEVSATPLWLLSWVTLRLRPGRSAVKMAEFSHTEQGSGLDMLAAVEETPRREMRARYFQHALDELKHNRLFSERATALDPDPDRTRAVLSDSGYITSQGINSRHSLFSTMDEVEFLAFVWVHECHGERHFALYAELLKQDADARAMFQEIAKDENFHVTYSRAELDRYAAEQPNAVRWAVFKVRCRRKWQWWLRRTREFGEFMSRLWMSLFYVLIVGPFSLVARASEKPREGWRGPGEVVPAAERARELG